MLYCPSQIGHMCVQGIHVLNVRRFPDPGKEFFLGNQGALLIDQVFQDLRSLGAQVSNSLRCEHTLFLFVQEDVSVLDAALPVQWRIQLNAID